MTHPTYFSANARLFLDPFENQGPRADNRDGMAQYRDTAMPQAQE